MTFTAAGDEELRAGLAAAARDLPDQRLLLALHLDALVAVAEVTAPELPVDEATTAARAAAGEPLLTDADLGIAPAALAPLERALRDATAARGLGADAGLVREEAERLTHRAWARALADRHGDGHPSATRRCPVCGGEAALAALTQPDGERHLLCARCEAEWTAPRIGCAYCGDADPASYRYHQESPACRVYACASCGRELRTIDQREQVTPRLLVVEQIVALQAIVPAVVRRPEDV